MRGRWAVAISAGPALGALTSAAKVLICGVSRVLDLLANTDARLHQIAYALGYSQPGPLVRAFKRWTDGIAMQYRCSHDGTGAGPTGNHLVVVSCLGSETIISAVPR